VTGAGGGVVRGSGGGEGGRWAIRGWDGMWGGQKLVVGGVCMEGE